MTQTKIQGKFYPLQHQEWLRACRELTPSQRDVLYYIRTIDPYNQGVDINAAEVARQLSGLGGKVHRQTVSRALKDLDSKGFIDIELLQVRAKVKAKGLWCDETSPCDEMLGRDETPGCDETPPVIMTHLSGSPDTTVDHETPPVIVTHHTKFESVAAPKPENYKINKIYLDFLDSLLDSEREKFLEFGLKKAKELPKPPTLPQRWIAKHHLELHEQFKKTPEGLLAQDWSSHPHYQEWLNKIRTLGFASFIYESGDRDEERYEFFNWANNNKLIWEKKS